MADIYIPTLLAFANNNTFTGSCGKLRFRIAPEVIMATPKEVDMSQSTIHCELWHGDLCYELSRMEKKQSFPMSEEGRAELKAWLESNV